MLALLALVEAGHRAVVAHHAGPHFAAGALLILEGNGGMGLGRNIMSFIQISFSYAATARLRDRASSSQVGQNSCSPAIYPCLGQMEKVGVMVM